MLRPAFLSSIAFGVSAMLVMADEPLWTDEERAELSTMVLVGKVLSAGRTAEIDEQDDLYRAVVAIERKVKGDAATGKAKQQIALYFAQPKDRDAGKRCPAYVSLKVGQRAKFYVRLRKVGPEWRAFLEMGSDVQPSHS